MNAISKITLTILLTTILLLPLGGHAFKVGQKCRDTLICRKFYVMAAAAAKSTSISDSDSPVKILLHEKDGSTIQRDLIGTKEFPATNAVKIISWNVAGLRGTLKKDPEVLNRLVDRQQPDLLCLQVPTAHYHIPHNKSTHVFIKYHENFFIKFSNRIYTTLHRKLSCKILAISENS